MFKNIIFCLVLLVSHALLATDIPLHIGKLLVTGSAEVESLLAEKSNEEAGMLYFQITSQFIRPHLTPMETVFTPEELSQIEQAPKSDFLDSLIDQRIYEIKVSPEINYLKWTILALAYSGDRIPSLQLEEFFKFYEKIGKQLRTAPISGISVNEYLLALKNIDAISLARKEKSYDDIIWQMFVYNQPISSELMRNFRHYSEEPYFANAFSAFAKQVASCRDKGNFLTSKRAIDSLIFTKKLEKTEKLIPTVPEQKTSQVLFNQYGYASEEMLTEDENIIKGMPVEGVGYNIHFPQNKEYLGIVVRVYGGLGPEVVDGDFSPHYLRDGIDIFLLNHGYVVITLNLLDRLFLDTVQHNMGDELFNENHRLIHVFNDVISTRPEELISKSPFMNEDLKNKIKTLKGLDKYIIGQSFGAFMSVIQVLKFPGTFKGAIAMCGILGDERARTFNKYNAIDQIEKLSDRVFVLLNVEDSVAEAASSLKFYQEGMKLQKDVSLHLAQTHAYTSIISPEMIIYRNHGFNPLDAQTLPMNGKVLSFMKGESLDSDAEKQAQLLNMFDNDGKIRPEYLKTKYSKLWYYLKENLFLSSDRNNRQAARELAERVAYEVNRKKDESCSLQ